MEKLRLEGIIVKAVPFQEYDRIITLFTPNEGLIKLFVKAAFASKHGKGHSTTPLGHVEVICSLSKSELYHCHDISVLNHHLLLRKDLSVLNAACDILQTINETQQPGKAAPELYRLSLIFLKRLPEAVFPLAISTSFKLKTLHYEGLLGESEELLRLFDPQERELVEVLTLSRDFSLLAALPIELPFAEKVAQYLALYTQKK